MKSPHSSEMPKQISERLDSSLTEDGRYRLLIESIKDYAIFMLSPTGLVTSWNPGAERFKGYRADEIIGRHFSNFYTAQDREAGLPARALETAVATGKFEAEGWRVRKDGSRFWAYVVIDPIRLASGELAGFAKITRDLTERRAAEEALRTHQEQFRLLVQGVTDYAIYMLSPSGEIASWNSGAQRIKGYEPTEIIGSHFSRFYTEEDKKAGEPSRALAVAEREGRYEKEGWRVRKDGTRFWANVVIDAVRSDEGMLIGYAKVTRDVTTQREARQALLQAQKMDAIGQLTGGVAHDFNNLLTAILGSLDMLRKRLPDDAKARGLLQNAVLGAQRGAALTQRMLAFARRQELTVEAIDVPDLVRGMSELLQRSVGGTIEVEMRFPLALSNILTDANQLELALLNLVVNARDAMPNGGCITISAREYAVKDAEMPSLKGGRYVCLSVKDTGTGMDERTMQKALEPFFTTKGVGKGTGLGLPMVLGVTEQSGGTLLLKSAQGNGTTAEMWLPVAHMQPKSRATAPTAALTKLPAMTILVVDDDPLVLNNTVAMLQDLGHTVFEAESAEEALARFERSQPINLVITDHAMPHMTGVELVNILQTRVPNLPAIVATGFAELPANTLKGFVKLAKPYTEAQLLVAMSWILERTGVSAKIVPFVKG
jgi:PAS domain S-box-containing protein